MRSLSQSVDRRLRPVIRREGRGHGKGRKPFMSFRRRVSHRCPKIVVYDPRTGAQMPGKASVTWDGDTAWVAWTPGWELSRQDLLAAFSDERVTGILGVLGAQPALADGLADAILHVWAKKNGRAR